jgi:hypothetical protein
MLTTLKENQKPVKTQKRPKIRKTNLALNIICYRIFFEEIVFKIDGFSDEILPNPKLSGTSGETLEMI